MTHNTKQAILFNNTKFTPYSVPPAHTPASVKENNEIKDDAKQETIGNNYVWKQFICNNDVSQHKKKGMTYGHTILNDAA